MTHTHITDKERIKTIIRETFEGDNDLFNKFHFINDDTEAALLDTFFKIEELIDGHNSRFYALTNDNTDEIIGYINIAPEINVFNSFGLKKTHRSEKTKKEMMNVVESFFKNGIIICGLYNKNTRAIDFLKKNGYQQQEHITLVKTFN